MRRWLLIVLAAALATSACSNLGLGDASCVSPDREISPRTILTIQAVPTAKYTPCLSETRVGWDTVEWFAKDGEAGFKISRSISPFLTATVTPACDIGDAIEVESGFPDIQRYENIESEPAEIGITVIPSSERTLIWSRLMLADLEGAEIDGRPVVFETDDAVEEQVGPRVNRAYLYDNYVWVISELDAEEGKVELRGQNLLQPGRGLTPAQALEVIEDNVPDVFYKGEWYFVFEGGCITYEFDARGTLAETIADDAEEAFGFYPASLVIEGAEREGFTIR